ncbi:C40 family peptidase [Neobacillus sp. PS3-34]|uniref:C40 family peptidase n=1 Tax=Neobacillus sp. PS3-34 TaxID=3070678 RepID=UPI0027DF59A5|nr:C40 family peptidase [Neobacillus sp. PS3-34]WML46849.1 C40 family peptidase [Neobacillus sp. PS3-34]
MKKLLKLVAFLLVAVPLLTQGQTNVKAAEQTELTEYAKNFIGVPYVWGGTTPQGFDCSGFLSYVFKEYGVQLPRTSAEQFQQGEKISTNEMVPGDLVFFTTYKSGPSHAGIYLGDNKFIHASPHGVEIASLNLSYYKSRFLGAKRFIQPAQVKAANTLLPVKKASWEQYT